MPALDVLALGEAMVEFNQARADAPDQYLRGFGGDTSNMAIAAARLLGDRGTAGIRHAGRRRRLRPNAARALAARRRRHTRRGGRSRRAHRRLLRDPRPGRARVLVPARGLGGVAHAAGDAARGARPLRPRAARLRHQPGDQRERLRHGVRGRRGGGRVRHARFLRSQFPRQALAGRAGPRGDHGDDRRSATGSCRATTRRSSCRATTMPRRSSTGATRSARRWSRSSAAPKASSCRTGASASGWPDTVSTASTRPAPATASTVRSRCASSTGDTPFAAARYANAAAALATTGFGAVAPLPRDAEVRKLLDSATA